MAEQTILVIMRPSKAGGNGADFQADFTNILKLPPGTRITLTRMCLRTTPTRWVNRGNDIRTFVVRLGGFTRVQSFDNLNSNSSVSGSDWRKGLLSNALRGFPVTSLAGMPPIFDFNAAVADPTMAGYPLPALLLFDYEPYNLVHVDMMNVNWIEISSMYVSVTDEDGLALYSVEDELQVPLFDDSSFIELFFSWPARQGLPS